MKFASTKDKYDCARTTDDEKLIEEFSNDIDSGVRYEVSKNPNIPIKILEKLSNDIMWPVKCAVARNSNTPIKILEKISRNNYYKVRASVINNPSTTIKILEKLSKDGDHDVRLEVSRCLKITKRIIINILEGECGKRIIHSLYCNPSVSKDMKAMIFIRTGIRF